MYLWPRSCSRQSCSWQHSSHCRLARLPSQSCTVLTWKVGLVLNPAVGRQRSTVQPLFYSLLSQASQIWGSNSEMEPGDRWGDNVTKLPKLLLTVVSCCISSVATFLGSFRLPQAKQWNRKSKVHRFQAIAIRKTSSHPPSSRRSAHRNLCVLCSRSLAAQLMLGVGIIPESGSPNTSLAPHSLASGTIDATWHHRLTACI